MIQITTQNGKEDILDYITAKDIKTIKFIAVHPTITYSGVSKKFSITHIPSGMTIFGSFLHKKNAIKVAKYIVKNIPELENVSGYSDITDNIRDKYEIIKSHMIEILT